MLRLVVPRVDHGAALGEVQVAVGVAELLGLWGSASGGTVKLLRKQQTHEEVAGRSSDADHDEGERVEGRVALGHAVDH